MYIFATNIELRERWDIYYKGGKLVDRYDEKTVVVQFQFHPPKWLPMLKERDFVLLRTQKVEADGSILVLSRSIVHQSCPERKEYSRGEIELAGFVLRPCGNNSCVVVYIQEVGITGVPKYLKEKIILKRGMVPHTIRKFVLKEQKDPDHVPLWKK
jgi:hypothetical protein